MNLRLLASKLQTRTYPSPKHSRLMAAAPIIANTEVDDLNFNISFYFNNVIDIFTSSSWVPKIYSKCFDNNLTEALVCHIVNLQQQNSIDCVTCIIRKNSVPLLYIKKLNINSDSGKRWTNLRQIIVFLSSKSFFNYFWKSHH